MEAKRVMAGEDFTTIFARNIALARTQLAAFATSADDFSAAVVQRRHTCERLFSESRVVVARAIKIFDAD
jgi:hypothetical protein